MFGWILASIYGITEEIHQSFVPMRDASVFDVFADGLGSFAGAYFYKKGIVRFLGTAAGKPEPVPEEQISSFKKTR